MKKRTAAERLAQRAKAKRTAELRRYVSQVPLFGKGKKKSLGALTELPRRTLREQSPSRTNVFRKLGQRSPLELLDPEWNSEDQADARLEHHDER